jgi:hypothetical protein
MMQEHEDNERKSKKEVFMAMKIRVAVFGL